MTIGGQLDRARIEKNRINGLVTNLEDQIKIARSESQIGRTAVRFGPVGIGIAIGTGLDSQIHHSRLEGELANARQQLQRIDADAETLASELNNLTENIPTTRAHLLRNGCV